VDTHSEVGAKKIRIVRDKHAAFADCELELSFVRRLDQPGIGRGGHVDSAQAQSASDTVVDVLIEMKPNHVRPPCL
jgi:hypothetical protein